MVAWTTTVFPAGVRITTVGSPKHQSSADAVGTTANANSAATAPATSLRLMNALAPFPLPATGSLSRSGGQDLTANPPPSLLQDCCCYSVVMAAGRANRIPDGVLCQVKMSHYDLTVMDLKRGPSRHDHHASTIPGHGGEACRNKRWLSAARGFSAPASCVSCTWPAGTSLRWAGGASRIR